MHIKFLEDFKHKIGQWIFHRELKLNKKKSVSNLDDAKSIGILFEVYIKRTNFRGKTFGGLLF